MQMITPEQLKQVRRILANNRRATLARNRRAGYEGAYGQCVESSERIHSLLWGIGLTPRKVMAELDVDKGKYYELHQFVILKDLILDVTADQFSYDECSQPPPIFMKSIFDLTEHEQRWWWCQNKHLGKKAKVSVQINRNPVESLITYIKEKELV